mgnify:CR=1 FL=1
MKLTFLEDGEPRDVELRGECREEVPDLLEELLAGASDPVRLLVTEERVREARSEGRWLEVRFDSTTVYTSRVRGEVSLDQILVPLRHPEFAPEEGGANVTFFVGEGGWATGPLANPEGAPVREELARCVSPRNGP